MPSLPVILSEEAEDALAAIYRYSTDRWGAKRAESYLDSVEKAFHLLAANPRLGHIHPDISAALRLYPVGSHFVVYRIQEGHIVVTAILHMSMDMDKRLQDLSNALS